MHGMAIGTWEPIVKTDWNSLQRKWWRFRFLWIPIHGLLSADMRRRKSKKAMQAVHDKLATEYGVMLCAPPFIHTDFNVVRATLNESGHQRKLRSISATRRVGVWSLKLFLGNGDQAMEYFKAFLPAAYNDRAEIRQTEPYVYAQTTISKYNPAREHPVCQWLSGTASWAYFAFTQYILGISPDNDGLIIDPCLPKKWNGYKAVKSSEEFL